MDKKRLLLMLFPVAFLAMFVTRSYLAREQQRKHDAMMRSLIESSRQTNDEISRKAIRDATRLDLPPPPVFSVPPPVLASARAAPSPASSEEHDVYIPAREMPAGLIVARTDLPRSAVEGAPRDRFRDRAKRKSLLDELTALDRDLKALVGPNDKLTDETAAAALAPRARAALSRVEEEMLDGFHKKLAVEELTKLLRILKELGEPPDAGTDAAAP